MATDELTGQASSEFAKALGSVVLNYAYLEAMLCYNIWVLIDISDPDVGKIMTAGRPFSALIDLFDALYRHRVVEALKNEGFNAEKQVDRLKELVKKSSDASDKRNRIMHSIWASKIDQPDIHSRFRFTARRSKGLERAEDILSTEDVRETARFIAEVAEEVIKFSERFHSPLFWLSHWQKWTTQWQDWDKSGELQKWQEWMDQLPIPSEVQNKDQSE